MKKKILVPVVATLMLLSCMVGGTFAYLVDKTDEKVNTFTVGDVDIDLKETTTDYKMVPATEIAKDPKVTIEAGSEACYLFVEITESSNLTQYISYETADGWTKLTGDSVPNYVYYREVDKDTANQGTTYSVLEGDKVTVLANVTKEMLDGIENDTIADPTLTFTAYAIQQAGVTDAADAWAKIKEDTALN